jgi:putative copper export protein/mono/diheme cytochrome c family protein
VPPFDPEGGLWLALLRAVSVGALLSAFGTLVFGAAVLPRAFARVPEEVTAPAWRALARLARLSLLAALAGGVAWLVAEAGQIAGVSGPVAALAAMPAVVSGTFLGHVVVVRLAALGVALALLGRTPSTLRWRLTTVLCGGTVCLHAAHSHAMAMAQGPTFLLASQMLHLLAAGAWLGGLLPLLLVVRLTPPRTAAAACRWFSPLGKCCVAGIVLSAVWQFWTLVGGPVGMIGTAHGWTDAAKTMLLIVLLGFAVRNRYRLAPALLGGDPAPARRHLLRSLALQTAAGVLIVFVAAVLSGLEPAMHVQPVWPFAWRPSLGALAEPELRHEIELAALAALAGILLAACGLLLRRGRRLLSAAGLVMIAWAVPHFGLLLVEAYPTSFYRSPSGFSAASIATGAELYPAHCAACHGAHGRGDGPAAKGLAVPPADLTAAHLWDHSDGELFWWLTHGMDNPEGGLAMPGFADSLTEDERWALIDWVRANNAGLSLGAGRFWPRPTPAPRFEADCAGGRSLDLADLNGRAVRIVVAGGAAAPQLVSIPTGAESPDACANTDPATLMAYGLVAGIPPDAMAGTQFLVDRDGWLRAITRPGDPPLTDAAAICGAPVGGLHVHRH